MAVIKPIDKNTELPQHFIEKELENLELRRMNPSLGTCSVERGGCGETVAFLLITKDDGTQSKHPVNLLWDEESQLNDAAKMKHGSVAAAFEVPKIGELDPRKLPSPHDLFKKWGTHASPSAHAQFVANLAGTPLVPCTYSKNQIDASPIPEDGDNETEMSRSPESENRPDPDGPDTTEYEREDLSLELVDDTHFS